MYQARSAHQLLWTGFRGLDAAAVDLPFSPGGLVLFARNLDPDPIAGPARCRALIDGLQAHAGRSCPWPWPWTRRAAP